MLLSAPKVTTKRIQPGAPILAELVQPTIHLAQRSGINGVKPPRSFGANGGKAGFAQHP
jgi:hypothetical protein